jgi:hypothetical protein
LSNVFNNASFSIFCGIFDEINKKTLSWRGEGFEEVG